MSSRESRVRLWSAVLWPSFVMAGVLEALVFALVDPQALGGNAAFQGLELSRQGVYTLAFFVFWAVIAAAGAMTTWLLRGEAPPPHR